MPKRTIRRANGEGGLSQLPSGSWRASLAWRGPDGRQQRRWVTAPTKDEAKAKITEMRHALGLGREPQAEARTTLADFLAGWLERSRSRVRGSTWSGYESLIRIHVVPRLGRVRLAELRASTIEAVVNDLVSSGRGPTGVAIKRMLRVALGEAVRDRILTDNPAALAAMPKIERRGHHALEADELGRLLAALPDDEHGRALTLLAVTGMRVGEVAALHWSAIDLDARTLDVRSTLTKGYGGGLTEGAPKSAKSRRLLFLPDRAIDVLTRQERAPHDDLVFHDSLGGHITPWSLALALKRARTKAGISGHVRLHDLRHTAASLLLSAGTPVPVVAQQLGHADGGALLLRVYAAALMDDRKAVASTMDRVLGAS